MHTTTTSTRRTCTKLQLHVLCLSIREGVYAPFVLTSHSSATRHQWLNLFSTRHECFTSDVGLTRTRLVSCFLLTSLLMYELAVCSDGMTEAQPRSFRQNRPACRRWSPPAPCTCTCSAAVDAILHSFKNAQVVILDNDRWSSRITTGRYLG